MDRLAGNSVLYVVFVSYRVLLGYSVIILQYVKGSKTSRTVSHNYLRLPFVVFYLFVNKCINELIVSIY